MWWPVCTPKLSNTQMVCDVADVNCTYKQKDCTVHQNVRIKDWILPASCIYVFRMTVGIIREHHWSAGRCNRRVCFLRGGIWISAFCPGLVCVSFVVDIMALWQFFLVAVLLFFPAIVIPLMLQYRPLVLEGRSGEAWEPSEPQFFLFPSNKSGVTKYFTLTPFDPFISSRQATEESVCPMAVGFSPQRSTFAYVPVYLLVSLWQTQVSVCQELALEKFSFNSAACLIR